MLDVALFMSNATRLKVVLEQGPSLQYYATLIALLSVSLLLQVVIGILLVVIGKLSLQSFCLGAPWWWERARHSHETSQLPANRANPLYLQVTDPTVRAPPVLSPHIPSIGTHRQLPND
ncbi:Ninj2 [Lemmus lemmus]